MDNGRAMPGAKPDVLFTYSSLMGENDKIRWSSLQDGDITRFFPQDDHGKVVSVPIQRPRLDL